MLSASSSEFKKKLYKETRDRKIGKQYKSLEDESLLAPIANLSADTPPPTPIRYAYRSFDRQWALLDRRLCDRPSPNLISSHGDRQVYMVSFLSEVLGDGPSAAVTPSWQLLDTSKNFGTN